MYPQEQIMNYNLQQRAPPQPVGFVMNDVPLARAAPPGKKTEHPNTLEHPPDYSSPCSPSTFCLSISTILS